MRMTTQKIQLQLKITNVDAKNNDIILFSNPM